MPDPTTPFTKLRSPVTKHRRRGSDLPPSAIHVSELDLPLAPPNHPHTPLVPHPQAPIYLLPNVEGLTNDEVKSHLQKYRLHVPKIPSCLAASGLWMSQDHSEDHSKSNISQSGSPQGPLAGNGSTKDSSMKAEEDEKSDGHSWKGGSSSFHKIGENV